MKKHKKLKYASLATLYTILFLAGLILLNLITGMLTERFFLKADMTSQKIYEVDPQAREVLAGMSDTVDIYLLAENGDYGNPYLAETLVKYQSYAGGKLNVQTIDPNLNPLLLQPYIKDKPLDNGQIVVARGERFKLLNAEDLYETETQYDEYGYGIPVGEQMVGFTFDQVFASAIQSVLLDLSPVVVFSQGHGEPEASVTLLEDYFTKANYTVVKADLSREELPEETKILVVFQPTSDFTADEIAKVDVLLTRQAGVLYFSQYGMPALPVFDRFLADWGLAFEQAVTLDATNNIQQQPLLVVTHPTEHDITAPLLSDDRFVFLPMARPVVCPWVGGSSGYRSFASLVDTERTAYARPEGAGPLTQDNFGRQEGDLTGPFSLAAITTQITYDTSAHATKAFVAALPTNLLYETTFEINFLTDTRYLNYFVFDNTVSYINQEGKAVVIAPKSLAVDQLRDTSGAMVPVLWLLVIGMPLVILVGGFLMWRRRRTL